MAFIYNLGIFFYILAIRLVAPFNEKARLFIRGRRGWQAKLKGQINPGERYLWFHCASLGEFEQGRPVIEEIKSRFPDYKILLTFFSPSGYEIRKNYNLADVVCYLPSDTRKNAKEFLEITRPEKVFFVKYEFWYNYFLQLKKADIPFFIISAIFRENQLFFKKNPVGKWYRNLLFLVSHFFVQDEKSGQLLAEAGLGNYTIAGDTRFDRVSKIAAQAKPLPVVEKFRDGKLCVVVGSSWKPDEELIIPYINQSEGIKFIIAPHEVSAANVNRILQQLEKPAVKYSAATEKDIETKQVLIIDSIGLLSSLYMYGDLAYIGGGFGVGIHNILEAATFGQPVVFGPNYAKFREAVNLAGLGGAFSIGSYSQLAGIFDNLINNPEVRKSRAGIARDFVNKNLGAANIILTETFRN